MKWSRGPIVGRATVKGMRQFERCTSEVLRNAVSEFSLVRREEYWKRLPPAFSAVAIYLDDETWLDRPINPRARSRSESWIVLSSSELVREWLTDVGERSLPAPVAGTRPRPTRTLSLSIRFEVLRRDGFTCQYCGRKTPDVKLHVDHVLPWSAHGSNNIENLRTACQECNLGKGTSRVL